MANQVLFHPTASSEYEEAYLWYEEQREGLGLKFQDCIEKQLRRIIQKPLHYPTKKGQHREAMIETFPFVIVYKYYAKESLIFVSAVFHTSRNPKKKYRRR